MIEFKSGNILEDSSDAIVNTVNCVGVMGKGLALQFKKAFPKNYKAYKYACDHDNVKIGEMFITEESDLLSLKYIINFPTKKHWKSDSKIEYIHSGLDDLIKKVNELRIDSIAIPPLGAGLGGLDWVEVKKLIAEKLTPISNRVHIVIYEPNGSPDSNKLINNTLTPKMTKGRALLIKLLEFYAKNGYPCSKLETQKLAYFLQESGVDLRLQYKAHHFGPYADNLNHVLERIDGHFITGFGDRISKSEIRLVPDALIAANEYLKDDKHALDSLKKVQLLINGYETPLSMEVISTIHWVIKHEHISKNDFTAIKAFIHNWNTHKSAWKDSYLIKAIKRCESLSWL